jgi:hypothetical protein
MLEEWNQDKIIYFGEEITEVIITNPKTVLGSSAGEDVWFTNNNNNNNNN